VPKQFEPIMLTGCNEESVKKDGDKSYRFPFCLSNKPPQKWQECFNEQWKLRGKQDSAQRVKAYVKKNELVLVSQLDALGSHLANLKADIDAANRLYLEHIEKKDGKNSEKKRKREEKLIAERRAIHDALDGLTFANPGYSKAQSA
jgi:hypothetical protein